MTCIIGIKHKDKIYIGGDRRTTWGLQFLVTKESKVFKSENFIIGACGSVRESQILKHVFKPPIFNEKTEDLMSYLCGSWSKKLIETFIEHGTYKTKEPYGGDGGLILGYKSRLFVTSSDLSFMEPIEDYVCHGSGAYHASAVMDYLKSKGSFDDPEKVIEEAIKIAAGRIWSVDDQVDILSLGFDEGGSVSTSRPSPPPDPEPDVTKSA